MTPWRVGYRAIKANALPMLVLWILAAATVVAYYASPAFAATLEPLRRFQVENGWLAAFANRMFFCGILPGVFLVAVRSIRPRRPCLTVAFQTLWCGVWGIACDFFYRFQCVLFGSGLDFQTLLLKTCVNQFVWTVFIIAPVNAAFFFWLGRDCSVKRMRKDWPPHFLRDVYAPNLLSNWCVWIPVFFAIYAFPLPLQVQLSGIVGCFWSLVCLRVGAFSGLQRGSAGATRAS